MEWLWNWLIETGANATPLDKFIYVLSLFVFTFYLWFTRWFPKHMEEYRKEQDLEKKRKERVPLKNKVNKRG